MVFEPHPKRAGPTKINPPLRSYRRRLHPVDENDAMTLTRFSLRKCRRPRVEFVLKITPIMLDESLFFGAPGKQRLAAPTRSLDRERAASARSGKYVLHQQMKF
jgi:hypothetical protein